MLAYLVGLALAAWGVLAPPVIDVEWFSNEIGAGIYAQTGYQPASNYCLIGVSSTHWNELTPDQQLYVIEHEVGHCLGLDHYGSCNYNVSVMGCATGTPVTDYDRLRYKLASGRGYKIFAGGLALD